MSLLGLYVYYLVQKKGSLTDADKKQICIVDREKLKYFLRDERDKYERLCKRKKKMDEESKSKLKKPKRS